MNILIIQTAFLGDLVLTTSFFREVYLKYPNSKISVVVNKGTESILQDNPYLFEVISFDKKIAKKSITSFFQFALQLRKKNFSIVYSPHFSFRSSILSYLTGAKIRIGYKQSGFSFLHTVRIQRPIRGLHEVEKLFQLLGIESSDTAKKRPELYLGDTKAWNEKQSQLNLEKGKFIVIAPSSLWETKRLPKEKFVDLIHSLLPKINMRFLFVGSPQDIELSSYISEDIRNRIKLDHPNHADFSSRLVDLTGKTSLRELGFWISESALVVSNDSSPIHFASAFNIPTLMVYGATVRDFGYYSLSDRVEYAEVEGLSCRPCGIHGGHKCPETHFKCMKDQDINSIVQKILFLLSNQQRQKS